MIWGLFGLLMASLALNLALTRRVWQLTSDVNFVSRVLVKHLNSTDGDAETSRLPPGLGGV